MLTHKQEMCGIIESVSMERIKKLGEDIRAKIAALRLAERPTHFISSSDKYWD